MPPPGNFSFRRSGISILSIVCFTVFAAVASADIASQIDPLFSDYDRPGVPGASVAIFQDDKILYEKGYGLANLEANESAIPQTNYRLASLTKQFTAMAVLQLEAQGKLSFDETLADIFTGFPSYGKQITVRHLLGHVGGLHDYEDLIPDSQTTQVSDADVLEMMKSQSDTYFTPGSEYRYSNTGYVMLSNIVELRSGQSFADYVEAHIFGALGMSGSRIYRTQGFQIDHRAYGYTGSGSNYDLTDQSVTSATLGDGGVYTSVHDYFLWDEALYTERLVPADLLQQAFTSGTLNNGEKTGYGFGWEVGTYQGIPCISHTGSTIGFRTAVQRFPTKHFSVVVLVNRAGASPWDTASAIVDRLLFNRK